LGLFTTFLYQSVNRGNVAFSAGNSATGFGGVYTNIGGVLNRIADSLTPIPGGVGSFNQFYEAPSLSNGSVAFSGGTIAGQRGVYLFRDGALTRVADRTTPVPGGSGNFSSFNQPSLNGDTLVFTGGGGGRRGIYLAQGSLLTALVDTTTPIPDGSGSFTAFGRWQSLDGDRLAFVGSGVSGQVGIYTLIGGQLTKVIDLNDILDGKQLSSLEIGPDALRGSSLAFDAQFTDGTSGIFLAQLQGTVPEPSTYVLFGLGTAGLLCYHRLRRQPVAAT
jgi:hypothetical protein